MAGLIFAVAAPLVVVAVALTLFWAGLFKGYLALCRAFTPDCGEIHPSSLWKESPSWVSQGSYNPTVACDLARGHTGRHVQRDEPLRSGSTHCWSGDACLAWACKGGNYEDSRLGGLVILLVFLAIGIFTWVMIMPGY